MNHQSLLEHAFAALDRVEQQFSAAVQVKAVPAAMAARRQRRRSPRRGCSTRRREAWAITFLNSSGQLHGRRFWQDQIGRKAQGIGGGGPKNPVMREPPA